MDNGRDLQLILGFSHTRNLYKTDQISLAFLMALLYRHLRVHQIFGANTDVGKTIFATALVRASAHGGHNVLYLKPVSTGDIRDADDLYGRCVISYAIIKNTDHLVEQPRSSVFREVLQSCGD